MAIATPTSLGTSTSATTTSSYGHTTTAVVPSAGFIVVCAAYASDIATPRTGTMSGGGLTWVKDHEQTNTGSVGVGWTYMISSAQAPSGLASSTALTLTLSGQAFGAQIAACYTTGIETTNAEDVSDGANSTAGTTWDTTATSTTVADTFVIGGSFTDASTSNTATGGATELFDFTNANGWGFCVEYKIQSSATSTSLTGTWAAGSGVDKTQAFVAYKGEAAGFAAGGYDVRNRVGRERGRFPLRGAKWY